MSNSGELRKITFLPGINKNSTDIDSEGKWVDCDKVRFRYGKAEKIGGWVREQATQEADNSVSTFTGIAREVLPWNTLNSDKYLGIGTHAKLEFFFGGEYFDMTPIDRTVTGAVFTTSVGSTDIICSLPAHGATEGDYVIFTSATTSVGGVDIIGEHLVGTVIGANSFTFTTPTTATSTSVGATANAQFLIGTGLVDNSTTGGWGTDPWSTSAWGEVGSGTFATELRQWSLENWGEDLLANPKGLGIYTWDADNGVESTLTDRSDVRLTSVANSPAEVNVMLASQPTRHLIAGGCNALGTGVFDPMLIRWSHSEDFTVWDPLTSTSSTNEAGDKRLRGGNEIIGMIRSKAENVIFTDDAVHSMRWIGNPFIYSFNQIGTNAGICGPQASVDVNGVVYWMGRTSFFVYDGTMRVLPSTLQKAIFEDNTPESLNLSQKEKVFTGVNSEFNEIIWFYPAASSLECNRYVVYNYLEKSFYDGTMDRTAWVDKGVYEKPYGFGSDSVLYVHEEGKDDDGSAMRSFIKSGDVDIADGELISYSDKFVPDFTLPSGKTLNITLESKRYPNDPTSVTKGPFTVDDETQKVSYRMRGRQFNVTYSTSITGGDFIIGAPRINIMPDGGR